MIEAIYSCSETLQVQNPVQFKSWIFPAKEVGFKVEDCDYISNPSNSPKKILIVSRLNSSDSVMELLMAVNAIRHINKNVKIELYVPYIPYGRQDRFCAVGESFSLKVFADIINGLNLNAIYTISPHSNVTSLLIHNLQEISIDGFVRGHFLPHMFGDNPMMVAPDIGAVKRTESLINLFLKDRKPGMMVQKVSLAFSNKKRDSEGNIIGLEVFGEVGGKDCFIYDDICDGGRTFIELAKVLKEKGANDLYLFVTHGIFSKGFEELYSFYRKIVTTNSFRPIDERESLYPVIDVYSYPFVKKNIFDKNS